jgi:hypothetical protein
MDLLDNIGLNSEALYLTLQSGLITLAGLVSHIFKKSMDQEISPIKYVMMYRKRTILSLSGIISSFIALAVTHPTAGAAAFFALGYVLDSAINKAPTKVEVEYGEGTKSKADLDGDGLPG